jgi:N-acetyl-anhydromuramyl-L-alanine amidase AmpD
MMRIAAICCILLSTTLASAQTTRPTIVSVAEWGSKPQPIPDSRRQTPQWITIHHAGELWTGQRDPADYVRAMQAWGQKEKHWPDLPYHFLIAPDGRIFEGRPVEYEPDSNTNYAVNGNIGVELMGNFEVQRPSPQQLQSCVKLVAWLAQEYKIPADHIRGHRDAAQGQTECPGKDFYRYLADSTFRRWVEATLRGEAPPIQPSPPLNGGPTAPIPTTRPVN